MIARALNVAAGLAGGLVLACAAHATALEPAEVAALCGQADGLAHCGRLVEDVQLGRAPHLATRDGARLTVHLYPAGERVFDDVESLDAPRSFSVWDFLDGINAVVLYATAGDDARFLLLQRVTGRVTELPAAPQLSPDRQRLATADFCTKGCVNELAVWRVTRDGVQKEAVFTPPTPWADAATRWSGPETLAVEFTAAGEAAPRRLERRLADPGWRRLPQP